MAPSLLHFSVAAKRLTRSSERGLEAIMNRKILSALGLALFIAVPVWASPPSPARTLEAATDVLNDFAALPVSCIPASLLADAQGIAILPHVTKGGLFIGGRGGHGVILTRDQTGAWSGATFVNLGGASFGLQAGIESADVVLVFRTRRSLDRLLSGKAKLLLGADAGLAAGPVGRQAEAGTDARLQAEILSYSRSRGLFAGVALDGAALLYDRKANEEYQWDRGPEMAQRTLQLLARLTQLSAPPRPNPPVIIQQPVIVPGQTEQPRVVPVPTPLPPPSPRN
jgi:lipid-binding SYLF domain-containing protein